MHSTLKEQKYSSLSGQMKNVLSGESNRISIMSTMAGLLKQFTQSFYWVGFYLEDNGVLKIGPYQGTLGCLTIDHHRGICGRAFRQKKCQIVDDVHSDDEHIACDPASVSEIVIPVLNKDGSVYAVLDIDSTVKGNFDETDRYFLETMIKEHLEPYL